MKLVKKFAAIFDRTNDSLMFLAVLVLVFIMLSVTAEVVMRYFLGRPLIWVVDFSEYGLVWITFLGTAWVLRRDGHIRMDLIISQLKPRTQLLLNIVTSVVGAGICLALSWYSAEVTWDHFVRGVSPLMMVDIPKAPVMAIIPIGSILLFIQFLRRSYSYLEGWRASPNTE